MCAVKGLAARAVAQTRKLSTCSERSQQLWWLFRAGGPCGVASSDQGLLRPVRGRRPRAQSELPRRLMNPCTPAAASRLEPQYGALWSVWQAAWCTLGVGGLWNWHVQARKAALQVWNRAVVQPSCRCVLARVTVCIGCTIMRDTGEFIAVYQGNIALLHSKPANGRRAD